MRINFDHLSATSPLPEVLGAMEPYLKLRCGNPSSLHSDGILAKEALARARTQFANFINAPDTTNIIFTGGGTEAVNLAIKGCALENAARGKHIVFGATEHPSVYGSIAFLKQFGFSSTPVPVDAKGGITVEAIRAAIRPDTILLCFHHANHEVGTIFPIADICELAAEIGIPVFVDAVGSAGWLTIDVQRMNIGMLALSPHRFYGPKGVGVLYKSARVRLQPIIHGGGQEEGLRAGTENVAGIVGAGVAAEFAQRNLIKRSDHARGLQLKMNAGLKARIEHLQLNGPKPGEGRLPNNLNYTVKFVEGEGLALMMDVKGFSIGSGSSCMTRSKRIPPPLAAMGLMEMEARGIILLGFGQDNSEEQVEKFLNIFPTVVHNLREMSPEWEDFLRMQKS